MDPYLDPVSGLLRNRLAISDAVELARVEAALSASRLVDLERRRLPGSYDLDHMRAFHRYILGDVYDWAGALRTVSIAKGSVFCLPQHLAAYAADVFGRLAAADRLRGLNREQFIGQIADWVRMDPERNIAASAAAHHGDLRPMTAMLGDLVDLPHPPGPAGPSGGRAA